MIPIGFAHAGFGANDEANRISTDIGTTYQLVLARRTSAGCRLPGELLAHSETYLREQVRQGDLRRRRPPAQRLLSRPLRRQRTARHACRRHRVSTTPAARRGYREIDRVHDSAARPRLLSRRRSRAISGNSAAKWSARKSRRHPSQTWWEACTTGAFERIQLPADAAQQLRADGRRLVLGYRTPFNRLGPPHRRHVRSQRALEPTTQRPRHVFARRSLRPTPHPRHSI